MLTNFLAAWAHLTISVSGIQRDIGENNGRKAGFFHTPFAFNAIKLLVRRNGSRRNSAMTFGTEKLEWIGYPMVKKF